MTETGQHGNEAIMTETGQHGNEAIMTETGQHGNEAIMTETGQHIDTVPIHQYKLAVLTFRLCRRLHSGTPLSV